MADARQQADDKARAAGKDVTPVTALRLELEALRLEVRASVDLLLAKLDEVTVEQMP